MEKPEVIPKVKKVNKAVTSKTKKGYGSGYCLGIYFERNSDGTVISPVLDYPLEDPKNMQSCYNCGEDSEQPHYQGKVQSVLWNKKEKHLDSIPPNCPFCSCRKLGAVKENGVRPNLTRSDGSNILSSKQGYMEKNSDMSQYEIANLQIEEKDDSATMDVFENGLPLSDFTKVGYVVKEKDEFDYSTTMGSMIPEKEFYNTSCSFQDKLSTNIVGHWLEEGHRKYSLKAMNHGMNHNRKIKEAVVWFDNYHTNKATLHQDNTCFKHFGVYPHRSLSYYQVEKLMKEGFSAKMQYRKICDSNPDGYESEQGKLQLEKRDVAAMRLNTGQMNAGPPREDRKVWKKDYEKETMDREFKNMLVEIELKGDFDIVNVREIYDKVQESSEDYKNQRLDRNYDERD